MAKSPKKSESITLTIASSLDPATFKSVEISRKELTVENIMKVGSQQLKIKESKQVFLERGDELQNVRLLNDGDMVFVSSGLTLDNAHEVFHICMLGAGAVGKSALTLQFIQGQFVSDYDPTIEDAYRKPVNIDGSAVLLDVLDTAGQEDFIALRTSWMRNKDGFVLVFSIVDRKSFEDLESFYDQLCEVYEDNVPPFVLVGNKADLDNPKIAQKNPKAAKREIPFQEAYEKADKWNAVKYIETSALTGQNVQELYGGLVREILSTKIDSSVLNISKKHWWEKCSLL